MRRVTFTAATSLGLLVLTTLPAIAAEDQTEGGTRGSVTGVLVGLAIGFIFAIVVVTLANRDVRFGQDASHAEDAYDIREGFEDYDIETPPTGEAQHTETHAP